MINIMQKYVCKYYTEDKNIIPTQYGGGWGVISFRSGGFGWGGGNKTEQGNFQMHDGNGFGNGAYIFCFLMFDFDCRRVNFWEIEITSK